MPQSGAHTPDQDEVELTLREKAGNLAEARSFAKEAGEAVDLGPCADEPQDLEALPIDDEPPPEPHLESLLDAALEGTFPASDPVSITPED
jgi:hypothetical protein